MLPLITVLLLDYFLLFSCTNYVWFIFVWCCVLYAAYYICLTTVFNRSTNELTICFFFFSIFYYCFVANKCSPVYSIFAFYFFLLFFVNFFFTFFSTVLDLFIYYVTSIVHHLAHLLSWH